MRWENSEFPCDNSEFPCDDSEFPKCPPYKVLMQWERQGTHSDKTNKSSVRGVCDIQDAVCGQVVLWDISSGGPGPLAGLGPMQ